jgi:hypothetical protein
MYWDPGHPYRWRTWLRTKLPWILINIGLIKKGEDCEKVGGKHWWYKQNREHSACYHCKVVRRGQLWKTEKK